MTNMRCAFATKPEPPVSLIGLTTDFGVHAETESTLRVVFGGSLNESVFASLHEWGTRVGIIKDHLPKVDRLVFSGPATVTLFSDNTKCVTKCKDGDDYDPLFGVMACLVRRLTRNRGHAVDEYEPELKAIASEIQSPDDVKRLADHYAVILDTLEMLDESSDKWLEHLGEGEHKEDIEVEQSEAHIDHEAVRQAIRDLIDSGEL